MPTISNRLPFVLNGAPLFKVFALFGKYLTGTPGPHSLWEAVGWTYHFSNGAALGIMFLAMVPSRQRAVLFWGAVGWALFVETVLLLTPYAKFFGLALNGKFIFYTASAHGIFGVALGHLDGASAGATPRLPDLHRRVKPFLVLLAAVLLGSLALPSPARALAVRQVLLGVRRAGGPRLVQPAVRAGS